MAAGNPEREDLLAELLAALDEQLAAGTADGSVDTSAIAGDDELAAAWEADRRCLEKVARVRRLWSPDEALADTQSPDAAAVVTPGDPSEHRLGRFRILRELGHGGLGIVYLAYDPKLNRQVALKVPRLEALASSGMRRRFLREAEAAARLGHPHLVAVYDFGEEGPLCYIAAEFCPGPTLGEWIRDREQPVPCDTAARLVQQLASAVQHAHGRGVLHRDIKPSNVLLVRPEARGLRLEHAETNGQPSAHPTPRSEYAPEDDADGLCPKLTDFGMAKLLEREGEETRSGALVGTPAYMAPEQARGQVRELDARTDIYALGAVLYELLTARRAFPGSSDVEVLRKVLFDEPVNPRKLRPGIPRDLEAICLKCLAKSSDARYSTAQQLADDLDRFLAGRPTEARPLGAVGQVWKWARRRPAVAALAGAVAAAALTLFGIVVAYNARLTNEVTTSRQLLYTADVRLAYESWKANNVVQALESLDRQIPKPGEKDLREFAWHYLHEQSEPDTVELIGHQGDVFSVAWSPDGRSIATAGKDGTAIIWDAATGKLLLVLRGHTDEVTSVAFSPDGTLLASGSEDGTIRLWTVERGETAHTLTGHSDHVLSVAFSPDGRYLASGSRDGTVKIWKPESGGVVTTLTVDAADVFRSVTFAGSGEMVCACDERGHLYAWRTRDWEHIVHAHLRSDRLFSVTAMGDDLLATAGRREEIDLFEPKRSGARVIRTLKGGHAEWIQGLAYSAARDTLASAGKAGVIQLWNVSDDFPYRTLLGHKGRVWSVAWAPRGQRLASAGAEGIVKVWRLDATSPRRFVVGPDGFSRPAFTSDGALLVTRAEKQLGLWDAFDGSLLRHVDCDPIGSFTIDVSPDDRHLAIGAEDSDTVEIWSLPALERVHEFKVALPHTSAVAWDPHDSRVAYACDDRTVVLRNVDSGKIEQQFVHAAAVRDLVFTADGRYLATTSQSLDIWEVDKARVVYSQDTSHGAVVAAPDRNLIAAACGSNVTIVDRAAGAWHSSSLATVGYDVTALAIDGNTLVVGFSRPAMISFWDLRTHQVLMNLHCDLDKNKGIVFSPDGRRLLAAGSTADGAGCIWEWTIRQR